MQNTGLDFLRAALSTGCRCGARRRVDELQDLLAEREDDLRILAVRLRLAPWTVDLTGVDDGLPIPAQRQPGHLTGAPRADR